MKKVIVIAGPTASGKSDFAIEVAKRVSGEIISGDSIQVYRGLDIGSGKIKEEEKEGIPHYLLDILDPSENYSVADFQKHARSIIDNSDKMMIICGGTGLYLKSCLYDYEFLEEDGEYVDAEFEQYTNEELYKMLLESDPKQAEKIHQNNRRRLLRTLTIQRRSGKAQSELIDEQKHELIYDAYIIGCTKPRDILYKRINDRVDRMFEEGLEEEVKGLLDKGYTFEDPGLQGIGYKEWQTYFNHEMSKEEVKEEIQKHSRQFAKRQYTWLNHQMEVKWMDVTNKEEIDKMLEEVEKWGKEK